MLGKCLICFCLMQACQSCATPLVIAQDNRCVGVIAGTEWHREATLPQKYHWSVIKFDADGNPILVSCSDPDYGRKAIAQYTPRTWRQNLAEAKPMPKGEPTFAKSVMVHKVMKPVVNELPKPVTEIPPAMPNLEDGPSLGF